MPCGEYGMAPTAMSRHMGSISRSSSRMIKLYWSCIATKRVQPFSLAACCSLANCQAYIDEAPR